MNENFILDKSFQFSVRITKVYQILVVDRKEYFLSKQVLRAGTSVGAIIEDAVGGYSANDFTDKLNLAYKEARETKYWLRLLNETNYLEDGLSDSLINDCEELLKLLYTNGDGSK